MDAGTMRWIDRAVGAPMCFLLTLLRGRRRSAGDASGGGPDRVALVKLVEQGAWVVARPAVDHVVQRVGADNTYLVAFDESRPVLELLDVVPERNILTIRSDTPFRALVDTVRAIRQLRALGIDGIVDLDFFARASAVICRLSGAPISVGLMRSGLDGPYRGRVHTHGVNSNPRLHSGETFLIEARTLWSDASGLPAIAERPGTPSPPEHTRIEPAERTAIAAMIASRLELGPGLAEPTIVLFNPNADDRLPLRRWPTDRYVELAKRLLEQPDVVVVVTGTSSEAEHCRRLVGAVDSRRCIEVAGVTTLRDLVALSWIASAIVTNDSGPAHFAALAPIDVITLFGPESPHVFGTLSARSRPIWRDLACSPCVSAANDRVSRCSNNVCMQAITVDDVLREVTASLDRQREAPVEVRRPALHSASPDAANGRVGRVMER